MNGGVPSARNGAAVVALNGKGTFQIGGKTLTLTGASGDFAGRFDGAGGGLTVAAGIQVLSARNSYQGATSIAAGASLALAGTGLIERSSGLEVNGRLTSARPLAEQR